jgi:hypothetical protein
MYLNYTQSSLLPPSALDFLVDEICGRMPNLRQRAKRPSRPKVYRGLPSFIKREAFAMTTREIVRPIRNDLPMKLTIIRLGRLGPIAKQSDGYFRFQCLRCSELRATVNPSNNLDHCFCCGKNINNIDLMLLQGNELLPAADITSVRLNKKRGDVRRQLLSSSSCITRCRTL